METGVFGVDYIEFVCWCLVEEICWCFAEEEILRKYLFRIISIGNIHEITSFSNWIYVFHS